MYIQFQWFTPFCFKHLPPTAIIVPLYTIRTTLYRNTEAIQLFTRGNLSRHWGMRETKLSATIYLTEFSNTSHPLRALTKHSFISYSRPFSPILFSNDSLLHTKLIHFVQQPVIIYKTNFMMQLFRYV